MRHPLIRLVLAAALGAVAALALLGALALLNSGDGFAGTTAATTFGWLVPIGAVALGAVLAASLFRIRRPSDAGSTLLGVCRCRRCGGTVMGEWRLCPHCGAGLSEADDATECRLV